MSKKPFRLFPVLVGLTAFSATAKADVVPAALFSDHAVLQQSASSVPIWGQARPGEQVSVRLSDGHQATATADTQGKWMARLSGLKSGGPFTLTLQGETSTVTIQDVLVGEVWLASGQSNMDFTVARTEKKYFAGVQNEAAEITSANYPQIRMFTVDLHLTDTPQSDVSGHWAVCSPQTVGDMSAVAYFFARELYQDRKIPVGIIDSTWGASTAEAWASRAALITKPESKPLVEAFDTKRAAYTPEVAARDKERQAAWQEASAKAKATGQKPPRAPRQGDPTQDQHNPTVCYNGMIHPLIPYALRGAIWYQGESNGPTADRYFPLMKTLIEDWRQEWGQGDFPFLFVQLAAINKLSAEPVASDRGTPRVREGQLLTLQVPNTGMATAIDIGDPANIHPKNKQEVGRRLALIARARVYGEAIPYSGPMSAGMQAENGSIRLHFSHTDGGLVSKGENGKLSGFSLLSEDGKWVWADARIDGQDVIVSSPLVSHPTAVRYAWADNPPLSLYNGAGLPAVPFRTDGPSTEVAPLVAAP